MKLLLIPALIVLAMIMKSCVIYSPQTADIPLIHKKKDFRFDGGISLLIPSLNTTLSYGLTNKLAAQLYGNLGPDKEYCYHGALGYYKNLQHNILIEAYGGAGYGYGYYFAHASGESLDGNYLLPFTQLNIGKLASESSNLEFGMGIKTGFLHAGLTENTFDGTDPSYKYNGFLVEPTVFLRPGGKKAKANFKVSGCWIGAFSNKEQFFPYSTINFGISLNLR